MMLDKALRDLLEMEFEPDQVAYRPEFYCKTCADGQWICDDHQTVQCTKCTKTISEAHIHHPYIPIAQVRDRLTQVDPGWFWKPTALDPVGLPAFDGDCLWIDLTVGGQTESGIGDGNGAKGAKGRKTARSNAIKDAAAAFGVGVYLRALDTEQPPVVELKEQPPRPVPDNPDTAAELRRWIKAHGRTVQRLTAAGIETEFLRHNGNRTSLDRASVPILAGYKDHLEQQAAKVRAGVA